MDTSIPAINLQNLAVETKAFNRKKQPTQSSENVQIRHMARSYVKSERAVPVEKKQEETFGNSDIKLELNLPSLKNVNPDEIDQVEK